MTRAEYGSGSIYLRTSDNRWVGAIAHGYNADGKRRRITVTGKTEAQVKRKLRDKMRDLAMEQAAEIERLRAEVDELKRKTAGG